MGASVSTEFGTVRYGGFGYIANGSVVVRNAFAAFHINAEGRSEFFFEFFLERFDHHVSGNFETCHFVFLSNLVFLG